MGLISKDIIMKKKPMQEYMQEGCCEHVHSPTRACTKARALRV